MTRNYGDQMLLQYRQELPSLAHRNSRPVHRANVPRQRRTEDVSHGQKTEQHGCRAKMRKSTHCRRAGRLRPVTADGGQVSRRKGRPTAGSNSAGSFRACSSACWTCQGHKVKSHLLAVSLTIFFALKCLMLRNLHKSPL